MYQSRLSDHLHPLFWAVLLSIAICGVDADAARKRARAPAVKPWPAPQPLQIERFTLANGMRVVVQPDRRAPLVAMGLMVDVGSRDETSGRSGLAHFFEHMMFQGSKRLEKMEHFRALEAVGASLNANTSTDRTYYFEVMPVDALELAMWMEADRFANLRIDAANVANQRETVMEERRQSYGNRPYALSRLEFVAKAFATWQLQHPTIGSMADLEETPVEDFERFWHKWYTPNNVVLTLVGDLDAKRAKELAERYFGRLERRAEPKHRQFEEPEPVAHSWHAFAEPLGKMPAFHLGWRVPARPQADAYAIEVLAQVLDGGEASRLTRKLARETGLATRHFAGNYGRRDVDLFHVYVELSQPGAKATAAAKDIVRGAIADIALNGVAADELQRAKVAFEADWVFDNLSFSGRARELARYELYEGDASKLNQVLARYRAVSSDDLKRVARRYFGFDREVELDVLPKGVGPAPGAGEKTKSVERFETKLGKKIAAEAKAAERARKAEAKRAQAQQKREAIAAARAAKRKARQAAKEAAKEAREAARAAALAARQAKEAKEAQDAADTPPPAPPPEAPEPPADATGGGQ